MNPFAAKALGGLVACILCGVAGPARADPPDETVVAFGDLDLKTHNGAAALYARLEAAARIVCAAHQGTFSRDRIAGCIDNSVREAVARIGAPRLILLYETRSGHFVRPAR
ncbi:MAG TPA: UrcA family protein [Steroidobacteraceae bacterium]|nr:UrcA family protein [Steroidobacteraceae bacterium]